LLKGVGSSETPKVSGLRPNAFVGKPKAPTAEELAAELGPAKSVWDQLIARLAAESGISEQEWNSYSQKAGWALRLKVKKRNILYLSPFHGGFSVAFALGDKAVSAARQSTLPKRVLRIIEDGRKYAEGTAVRFEVTTAQDIQAVVKLASIKLQY